VKQTVQTGISKQQKQRVIATHPLRLAGNGQSASFKVPRNSTKSMRQIKIK